ncbi:MAG: DNA polymerase I [Desulfomicrobium sp.]|nr:DNA polymerase I [Pseudomonadota bacterium]MBV1712856.1 DNA polymerase I [Desulfomicrobium sp.]MBU4571826.1 DNA polymerase I [Pseudomonadota bacterium]MBU4595975.1 DNA polymerase I [Pseudomonadota bacterium]MBV1721279.1 DNA polymerase I [Desulfomicrobium sp.]
MSLQTRLGLKTEPLFLIDGHAFIYRGFYAYPDFKRSDGFPTSAMYIVFKLVLKLLREENPAHLVFVTDGRAPTFRNELLPTYKANRPRMPEGLAAQLEPLKAGLRLLGIRVLEAEGGEADDCIASLAGRFKDRRSVVIVGADKDLRQCLDENVVMWDPAQGKEKLVTREGFVQETGLRPDQWADFQAMTGDSADNIPGIPKVGPKTAMGFMRRFPSLDLLKENFHRLTAKEQTLLGPHMEQVFVYRQLTTLRTDMCMEFSLDDLSVGEIDAGALDFFKEYEFRSLLSEFQALVRKNGPAKKSGVQAAAVAEAGPVPDEPEKPGPLRIEPRLVATLEPLAGMEVGLHADGEKWILGTDGSELLYMGAVSELSRALKDARVYLTSYKDVLEQGRLDLLGCAEVFDIELAAYLLSPEERNYSLERIRDGLGDEIEVHRENHGQAVLAIGRLLRTRLAGSDLLGLMQSLELPLTEVLVRMQKRGIRIDEAKFRDFLSMVQTELDRLTQKIHAQAGGEFNIRSSQQLGEVLFSRLGLKSKQKTPGGAQSTSSSVLEGLAGEHPIVADILEFRMYEKLRSTYLEPLPQLAGKDGRIHTTFNQLATATGRLSSSNPNLQNIPIRGVLGPRMRSCFVAAPGNMLLAADYSQIELRVLAHMSGDQTLQDAFAAGDDIHARTAKILFEKAEVSPDERRKAKTINFGLLYGMGPQKLGRELGISLKEAKEFIAVYFSKLSRVREFYEEIEAGAKSLGFVTTLAGRRRMLPDINSRNVNMAQQARRMAINTVVQGSAADIIKKAMLEVDKSPVIGELGASLILQIHDELLLETPQASAEDVGRAVAGIMASVYSLSVPLSVDWGAGRDWSQAHQ